MRVHVIQVAYDDAEPMSERVERVADLVAAQRGADLVVLPELWAHTGFGLRRWAPAAEPLDGVIVRAVAEAARRSGAVVHAGSIVETTAARGDDTTAQTEGPGVHGADGGTPSGHGRWNTSVVLGPDGAVLATYRKVHLFGFADGEPSVLDAGDRTVTLPLPLPVTGGTVPTGLATCYDLRFPELFRRLVDAGAELAIVPAAWPAARRSHWTVLGRARAVENQMVVVQCNTAGTHARTPMAGHSQVIAADGTVLAEAGEGEEVLQVEVDLAATTAYRASFPVLRDRRW